jgi:hypothetical protein
LKNPSPILVLVLAVLLLLPGLAYFSLRLTLPGDASSPMVDFLQVEPAGLAVRPGTPGTHSLQTGDIVTAIQGRGIDQTIRDLLSPGGSTGRVDVIRYTVRRGDQTIRVETPLAAFSLLQLVKDNWSIYIYMIYLELVSLVVFVLRPRLAAAQLFFVVSNMLLSSGLPFFLGLRVDDLLYPWLVILYMWGAVVLFGFLLAALVHQSLIFPKPHPLLTRHPRWLLLIYMGVWLPIMVYSAVRWPANSSPTARLVLIIQGTTLMAAVYFPVLLLTTFSNYRTGNGRERRQIRWILWSLMISLIPYLVFTVLPSLFGLKLQLATPVLGILWCTVPTSFAISVLHERLFDIDVIIRRTLIYSALTVTLGAVYFFGILLLQGFFQVLTGRYQSPLATVLSTLMIALLFSPLRKRIQNDIDRRFYRRRYDADKILKEFAIKLRNEVDMEEISEDLINAVKETMEPQAYFLWIRRSKYPQRPLSRGAFNRSNDTSHEA